jgi:hypothetical protein
MNLRLLSQLHYERRRLLCDEIMLRHGYVQAYPGIYIHPDLPAVDPQVLARLVKAGRKSS